MTTYKLLADKKVVATENPVVTRDDGIALANVHLVEHPKTKEIVVSGDDGSIWKRGPSTGWKQEKKGESSILPKVGAAVAIGAACFAGYKLFFEKPTPEKTAQNEPGFVQRGTKVLGVFDSEETRDAFASAAHAAGAAFLGIAIPVNKNGGDLDAAEPYINDFAPDVILLGLIHQVHNGTAFFDAAIVHGKIVNVYTRGEPPQAERDNLTNLRESQKPFWGIAPRAAFHNLSGFARETLTILTEDNPSDNERILLWPKAFTKSSPFMRTTPFTGSGFPPKPRDAITSPS